MTTDRSIYAPPADLGPLFSPIARTADPATSHAAAAEVTASGRRGSQCDAILAALRAGPKTNAELAAISLKYSGRVSDLRAQGHHIRAHSMGAGVWLYRLSPAPAAGSERAA